MSALVRVAPLSAPSRIPAAFAADVLEGLKSDPKYLSAKYFYDSTGSRLFERITQLPEYYPTRTELGILNAHAGEIAQRFPARAALIEFGSGSSMKASILLGAAPHIWAKHPDVELEHRVESVQTRSSGLSARSFSAQWLPSRWFVQTCENRHV